MEEEDCSSSWCVALRVGWTDMVALLFENGSGTIGLKEVEGRVSSPVHALACWKAWAGNLFAAGKDNGFRTGKTR